MSSLQKQVEEICNLADYVIKNPKEPIMNIAKSNNMLFAISVIYAPLPPIALIAYKIYDWINKEKRKKEEKERMLREVIAKQQAIIRELEKRLEDNRVEIENLKEMLRILKEMEQGIRNSA